MQPVYFAPAIAPTRKPQVIAIETDEPVSLLAILDTATTAKNAIHKSGAPAEVICQNTTGVSKNVNDTSHATRRDTHSRARHAPAAAANTPPVKSSARASRSLPSAKPAKISVWPCPVRKPGVKEKSG